MYMYVNYNNYGRTQAMHLCMHARSECLLYNQQKSYVKFKGIVITSTKLT